jgi:hypothetical protein
MKRVASFFIFKYAHPKFPRAPRGSFANPLAVRRRSAGVHDKDEFNLERLADLDYNSITKIMDVPVENDQ